MKTMLQVLEQTEEPKEKPLKKKTKQQNLKAKFPLQKGDILVMHSGEQYIVQHFSIRGIWYINEYSLALHNPSTTHHSPPKKASFSTLRELNLYAKSIRHEIQDVISKNPRIKEMTVDECYEEALKIEHAREQMKEFFTKKD